MPTTVTDGACMAVDGIVGNKNGEIRTVGAVADLVVGAKLGTLSQLGKLISSPKATQTVAVSSKIVTDI